MKKILQKIKECFNNITSWCVEHKDVLKRVVAVFCLAVLSIIPIVFATCNEAKADSAYSLGDDDNSKNDFFANGSLNLIVMPPDLMVRLGVFAGGSRPACSFNIPLLFQINEDYGLDNVAIQQSYTWFDTDEFPSWLALENLAEGYAIQSGEFNTLANSCVIATNYSSYKVAPCKFDVYAYWVWNDNLNDPVNADPLYYLIPPYSASASNEYSFHIEVDTLGNMNIPNVTFSESDLALPTLKYSIIYDYDDYHYIDIYLVQRYVWDEELDTYVDNTHIVNANIGSSYVKPFTQIQYNRDVLDYVYDKGYVDGSNFEVTPFDVLARSVDNFLKTPLIGDITFGRVFQVGFGLILLGFVIKIFLGG